MKGTDLCELLLSETRQTPFLYRGRGGSRLEGEEIIQTLHGLGAAKESQSGGQAYASEATRLPAQRLHQTSHHKVLHRASD
jgi:hypothetical protein